DPFDPILNLFDNNGFVTAIDDSNGGTDRCGDVTGLRLPPGDYAACVSDFDPATDIGVAGGDNTIIGIRLTIDASPAPVDEAGDTFDTATPLGPLPANQTFNINPQNDVDCWSFDITVESNVTITLDNGSDTCAAGTFDTDSFLFDSVGTDLGEADITAGDECGDFAEQLPAGTYEVCVHDFNDNDTLTGVTITVSATAVDDFGDITNPTREVFPFPDEL